MRAQLSSAHHRDILPLDRDYRERLLQLGPRHEEQPAKVIRELAQRHPAAQLPARGSDAAALTLLFMVTFTHGSPLYLNTAVPYTSWLRRAPSVDSPSPGLWAAAKIPPPST